MLTLTWMLLLDTSRSKGTSLTGLQPGDTLIIFYNLVPLVIVKQYKMILEHSVKITSAVFIMFLPYQKKVSYLACDH